MSIKLNEAIKNAKTFEDLIPIAEQLTAKISFFGGRWVEAKPTCNSYTGTVHITVIVRRARELIEESGRSCWRIKQFSNSEHEACRRLESSIKASSTTDQENYNNANIIAKIFTLVRCFFRVIIYKDYEYEWKTDGYGDPPQILKRSPYYEWNADLQKYASGSRVQD